MCYFGLLPDLGIIEAIADTQDCDTQVLVERVTAKEIITSSTQLCLHKCK